jgi:cytochrome c
MARAGATEEHRGLAPSRPFRASALGLSFIAATAALAITGCTSLFPPVPPAATPRPAPSPVALRLTPAPGVPGDPNAGRVAFNDPAIFPNNGCGSCHTLPGVSSGTLLNAPNLNNMTLRPTLAGDSVQASPANLKRWILDPQSVKSDAKMPKVTVTDRQAEDIAAFLYAYPYNASR